jgi:hypothetical protein
MSSCPACAKGIPTRVTDPVSLLKVTSPRGRTSKWYYSGRLAAKLGVRFYRLYGQHLNFDRVQLTGVGSYLRQLGAEKALDIRVKIW